LTKPSPVIPPRRKSLVMIGARTGQVCTKWFRSQNPDQGRTISSRPTSTKYAT
jgi:hypothetical protein